MKREIFKVVFTIRKYRMKIKLSILLLILSGMLFGNENYNNYWPNWRGPNCDGVSTTATPPVFWNDSTNIKWKIPIPGNGFGTPVVWDNQIFITTSIELKNTEPEGIVRFVVYSIDRETGEILWEKVVREQLPHEEIMYFASHAAASCVTDGKHMIASFGSYGIYCFDMTGNMIWEKDLGDMPDPLALGEGASPVIYKDCIVINWDNVGQSKIFVLDKDTGEEIWQKDRKEDYTWATPLIIEYQNKSQVIIPGKKKSISYDLFNGNIIWEIAGLDESIIASPVADGKSVYLMAGVPSAGILQCINLNKANGILDSVDNVRWSSDRGIPYVPSAILKDEKLYYLKGSRSQLSCVDAKTGKIYYDAIRIKGMKGGYPSPVCANGNIYVLDRKGTCSIIKEGTDFTILSQNKLDDNFYASPVVVGNDLILRGEIFLYYISK